MRALREVGSSGHPNPIDAGGELCQATCSHMFSMVKAVSSRDGAQWGWGHQTWAQVPQREGTRGDREMGFTGRGMIALRLNFPKGSIGVSVLT